LISVISLAGSLPLAQIFFPFDAALNTAIMLQLTHADAPTLERHIGELKAYLDKLIREKQSPIKIQRHRFHIEQLQLLLKSKSAQARASREE
jgi:hypothetical protein